MQKFSIAAKYVRLWYMRYTVKRFVPVKKKLGYSCSLLSEYFPFISYNI